MEPKPIPTSQDGLASLIIIFAVTAFVTMGRALIGKGDVKLRLVVGHTIINLAVCCVLYGAIVYQYGEVNGWGTITIACVSGLFSNEIMERLRDAVKNFKITRKGDDPK